MSVISIAALIWLSAFTDARETPDSTTLLKSDAGGPVSAGPGQAVAGDRYALPGAPAKPKPASVRRSNRRAEPTVASFAKPVEIPETPSENASVAPGAGATLSKQQLLALYKSARVKLRVKDVRGVIEDTNRILDADPRYGPAYVLRAQARNANREYSKAEDDARAGIGQNKSPAAYEALAWAQLRQGRAKQALYSAAQAIVLDQESAVAHVIRACAFDSIGDADKRLSEAQLAAEIDKRFQPVLRAAKSGRHIYSGDTNDLEFWTQGILAVPQAQSHWLFWLICLGAVALAAGASLRARLTAFWADFVERTAPRAPEQPSSPAQPPRIAAPPPPPLPAPPAPVPAPRAAPPKLQTTPRTQTAGLQLGRVLFRDEAGERWDAVTAAGQDAWLRKTNAITMMEARAAAALRHPVLPGVLELFCEGDTVCIATEPVSGKSVRQLLAGLRLEPKAALLLIGPVCEAMELAHQRGVSCRGVSPDRLFVTDQKQVRWLDLGVPVMDARYQGPERGERSALKENDLYALGVCFYELIVGQPPFAGGEAARKLAQDFSKPSSKIPGLPKALDQAIADMLNPKPELRPSPAEFLAGLRAAFR